jgi:hypothetical protein
MDKANSKKDLTGKSTTNILEENFGQPIVKGNRNVSMLKAELVRKNLVTRSDLMRLYQPPTKKSSLLENNPFFNKTIVGQYGIALGSAQPTPKHVDGLMSDKGRDSSQPRRRESKTAEVGKKRPIRITKSK